MNNDDDLEVRLRQYQPAGEPPGLWDRIESRARRRERRLAAAHWAAVLLLAATLALRVATAQLDRSLVASDRPEPVDVDTFVTELRVTREPLR